MDTGNIDLVVSVSEDGGSNWTDPEVIRRNRGPNNEPGKVGNPVPVFVASKLELAAPPQAVGRDRNHLIFRVRHPLIPGA